MEASDKKQNPTLWLKALAGVFGVAAILTYTAWEMDFSTPIPFQKLPAEAQTFLEKSMPGRMPVLVKREYEEFRITYEVIFSEGEKFEFRRNGVWKKIDLRHKPLPDSLIPAPIREFMARNRFGTHITKIKHSKNTYEIETDNSREFYFDDRAFFLKDADMD